jgi:hypothetical protein
MSNIIALANSSQHHRISNLCKQLAYPERVIEDMGYSSTGVGARAQLMVCRISKDKVCMHIFREALMCCEKERDHKTVPISLRDQIVVR